MRQSGILLHISSLPSPFGIGTFGKEAYAFVDFLKRAKQKYWQILPLGPTSMGDSPYSSFSTFAGNAYFIDLDALCYDGLLDKSEYENVFWGESSSKVDYPVLFNNRYIILRKAYARFCERNANDDFNCFCADEADWLEDYALFMSLKETNCGRSWHEWETAFRLREPEAITAALSQYEEDIRFWKFVQFEFYAQWRKLKEYANRNGVEFIGDLPIYVAGDSADVWANPELFDLDENRVPRFVAGCPPDCFSQTGQLWGNPVYNWQEHKNTGYAWWIKRLHACFTRYDLLRIDHFRGFAGYYAIPYGDPTAKNGEWRKGPSLELFDTAKKQLERFPVIAEDLGYLTPDVYELLEGCGFPGMKVLEFAFGANDADNDNLPHNIKKNSVIYCGTHDNMPVKEWIDTISDEDRKKCLSYMGLDNTEGFTYKFIKLALRSVANLAVINFQDYLELGKGARMNEPSTTSGNWQWRAEEKDINDELSDKIAVLSVLFDRAKS